MKKPYLLTSCLVLLLLFFSASATLFGQASTSAVIKGKVTEHGANKPMPGVTVVEVNENDRQLNGISTDEDGNYSLRVSSTKNKLRFSFINFESKTEAIGSRTVVNVSLTSDTSKNKDNEVTVVYKKDNRVQTGFTSIDKRDLIGSVTSVTADVLAQQPATSIDQMLQGRAAGVQVVTNSGDPGSGVDIRIRGAGSVSSGNDPLYIVDGIPIISTPYDNTNSAATSVARINPIADINPEDIERIDILKDANASAIYGARAANGVIIITTKRGKKGITNILLNCQFGTRNAPPAVPVLNGSQYKVMRLEALQNNGNINPIGTVATPGPVWPLMNDPTYPYNNYYQANTNWMSYLVHTGFTQTYNLSVSGGGDALRYNFSTSYSDQNGAFINTGYNRFTGRFNLDYKVSNKLRFSANISFSRSKINNYANYGQGSVYYLAEVKTPSMPVYDVDLNTGAPLSDYLSLGGIQSPLDNPVAFANTVTNDAFSTNLKPNVRVEYDIAKGLKFTNNTSLDFVGENGFLYLPAVATGEIWNSTNYNRIDTRDFQRTQSILDNLLTYNKTFGTKFKTSFLFGNTINTFNSNQLVESGYGNPSDQIQTLSGPARVRSLTGSTSTENIFSLFTQANLIYDDRFGFNFVIRRDGSSKFGPGNKYANFPSVGGYWRVSNEPFVKKSLPFISDMKIRATWGQLGNSGIPNYAYVGQFNSGANYLGYSGIYQSNPQLNHLSWETVESSNLGLDLELFKSRVVFTLDVYNKLTKNLLYTLGVPGSSGLLTGTTNATNPAIGNIYANLGNIQNRGIELNVNVDILRPKDPAGLRWNASFNIAHNDNKVTSLPGGTITFTDSYAGFTSQVKQGDPLGTYYGLTFKGVYATDASAVVRDPKGGVVYNADGVTPKVMLIGSATGNPFKGGDAIFQDYNHDGVIDDQDKVKIGNANPIFFGGFNNSFDYKSFGVRLFIQFQYGNDVINGMRYTLERMYSTDNQAVSVLNRWRKQGDITNIPRALDSDPRNMQPSTRWIEDGSYARLKSLSFTYRLPTKLVKKLRLNAIDVFLTGNNLITWTKYVGTDPEIYLGSSPYFIGVDQGLTPQSKMYTLGLNVKF